ncbi:MAG: helix-hairpin-helix domain-containing protein [Bacteroidetes bacterium]|nr:helix-hairpin-helix domain-containing protein [Bacteroidota bacterium]MBS1539279.1 helix-hairpin-helix domain-containing protein [Bacteroidota bacterium]
MKSHCSIILFFNFTIAWCQDFAKKDFDPVHLVDEIFSSQDMNLDYQDLYEDYLQLLSNPIDLNEVTGEQLRLLYILKEDQINTFLTYRDEAGPFLSEYELQQIFDKETFEKITPFVTVRDQSQLAKNIFKRIGTEANSYLLLRWGRTLENQQGYSSQATPANRYLGSPDNFYMRFRASRPADFSVGFTVKKDAGESVLWNASTKYYGFDFISFHVQAANKGHVKNLVLGDYQAQFGQGIALGSYFGIGKNAEAVITLRRPNLGFLPYTSLYEAGYFRGAALSYSLSNKMVLHTLLSHRGRDGNLRQDTTSSAADYLSSISYTGLHRTSTELINRNAVTESNLATILQWKDRYLDAGLLFHYTQFSIPLIHPAAAYNQYYFNGNSNANTGAYLNYNFKNISFFSEFTQTLNSGKAIVAGVLSSLSPQLDVSLSYRQFNKNFYSFYSNAISEGSIPQNETGVYWGWKYQFNKKYWMSGYVDLFSFPWLRYRNYLPATEGSEWLLRFNYKPSKNVMFFIQSRQETKPRNTGANNNLYLATAGTKQNYWINCDYATDVRLSFRSRLQFSSYSLAGKVTYGMVILQDITYQMRRLSLSGRYAIFDTDDYDNRQYVFEHDAYLTFNFPAYYGKGARLYLLLQCQVSSKIDVWIRWGQTHYLNQSRIGSGGDTITGDSKNDVKFQARIKF